MQPPIIETVADYDVVDEEAEELEDTENDDALNEPPIDPKKLKAELAELEDYRKLALSIGDNRKGAELIKALPNVFDAIVAKGGQRKAVIFTESVRTQKYLAELLATSGYRDDIVLLNGSNSDAQSKAIYEDWLTHADQRSFSMGRCLLSLSISCFTIWPAPTADSAANNSNCDGNALRSF